MVDSGFLYTLYNRDDARSADANTIAVLYGGQLLIPCVVLTEAAFLFRRAGEVAGVLRFLDELVDASYQFEAVLPADLSRVREIMAQYTDAKLDFVDCCIMALSERLNISQVCTFDRRDFSIFRPKHISHLELLL